jgi:hypothetical protein
MRARGIKIIITSQEEGQSDHCQHSQGHDAHHEDEQRWPKVTSTFGARVLRPGRVATTLREKQRDDHVVD